MRRPRRPLPPQLSLDDEDGDFLPATATAFYNVGGREYPVATTTDCRTCNSRYRKEIDTMLGIKGFNIPAVLRMLPEGHGTTIDSLRWHKSRHLPADLAAQRKLLERAKERMGFEIEEGDSIVTTLGLYEMIVQKSAENIAAGVAEVDAEAGMKAAAMIHRIMDDQGNSPDRSALVSAYADLGAAVYETARAHLPQAADEFMRHLAEVIERQKNPVAVGIMHRADAIDVESSVRREPIQMSTFGDDDAPARDSATVKIYSSTTVSDDAPARDSATAKVIRADQVEDDE